MGRAGRRHSATPSSWNRSSSRPASPSASTWGIPMGPPRTATRAFFRSTSWCKESSTSRAPSTRADRAQRMARQTLEGSAVKEGREGQEAEEAAEEGALEASAERVSPEEEEARARAIGQSAQKE